MGLKRKFATTLVFQSIGPVALFLSIWLIANELGLEAQGHFAAVKSQVELLTACLLFGLPQSFIFGINQLKIDRNQLVRWILNYGMVIVALTYIILSEIKIVSEAIFKTQYEVEEYSIYSAITISSMVTYGLLRSVFLTINDNWKFSAITIMPSVMLSIGIVIGVLNNSFDPVRIYALTSLLSVLVMAVILKEKIKPVKKTILPWMTLLKNGSSIFIQGILLATQPYMTLAFLRDTTGNYNDVGFFSLAMYVYQAGVIPLTMVAPILYGRWTSQTAADVDIKKREAISLLFGLMPVVVMISVVWMSAPWLLNLAFGNKYESAQASVRIMILTIPMLYIVQIGSTLLMSMGLFKLNIIVAASKVAICFISIYSFEYFLNKSNALLAAYSWFFAELVAAIMTLFVMKNKFQVKK